MHCTTESSVPVRDFVEPLDHPVEGLSNEELQAAFQAKRACMFCMCYRPMRSKHCHDCHRCVAKFDHHCFWIGGCVGELNHCLFYWFLVSACIMLALGAAVTHSSLDFTVAHPGASLARNVLASPCCVGCVLLLVFVVALLVSHTWLALTNQTTWEFSRRRTIPYLRGLPREALPFDEGPDRNLRYFCCEATRLFPRRWSLTDPTGDRSRHGFNWLDNQYYSCC
eukprot:TRINITY_DN14522_c0_g1_i1.p2 TRINITY_DN14522_c0_g1~~TRINITY_DN14522_c0_g1_i1.p2  ORF type:complete len:224 (-),score=60.05 TRINITY_DN14522_c0_g1_i1:37-708(-)